MLFICLGATKYDKEDKDNGVARNRKPCDFHEEFLISQVRGPYSKAQVSTDCWKNGAGEQSGRYFL